MSSDRPLLPKGPLKPPRRDPNPKTSAALHKPSRPQGELLGGAKTSRPALPPPPPPPPTEVYSCAVAQPFVDPSVLERRNHAAAAAEARGDVAGERLFVTE
ncbi:hypothetical protein MN608_07192 [Microdochium nivale]|nr:hypothetical protein MN608_07192 [Microdochium nivale]